MDIRHYFKCTPIKSLNDTPKHPLMSSSNNIIIFEAFTDGSTINNGSKKKLVLGGIGIFFNHKYPSISLDLRDELSKQYITGITNNIAELYAIKLAIESFINKEDFKQSKDKKIIIYTDSEYSINCITKWCAGWIKNNWFTKHKKEVKNKDLILPIYTYYKTRKIQFAHIKSHMKEPTDKSSTKWKIWHGNKMADSLAVNGSYLKINI